MKKDSIEIMEDGSLFVYKDKVPLRDIEKVFKANEDLIYSYIANHSEEELQKSVIRLSSYLWDTSVWGEYPNIPGICAALYWAIVCHLGPYKAYEYNYDRCKFPNEKDFFHYAVEVCFNHVFFVEEYSPFRLPDDWLESYHRKKESKSPAIDTASASRDTMRVAKE